MTKYPIAESRKIYADVNGDNAITGTDASLINLRASGKPWAYSSGTSTSTVQHKFTQRAVIFVDKTKKVKSLNYVISFAKNGTSNFKLFHNTTVGTNSGGISAGASKCSFGGTFTARSSYINSDERVLSFSVQSNDISSSIEFGAIEAKAINNTQIYNAVLSRSFIVGDLNNDKEINAQDYNILNSAINSIGNNISYNRKTNSVINGRLIIGFECDINDDGKISTADSIMLKNFIDGKIQAFPS